MESRDISRSEAEKIAKTEADKKPVKKKAAEKKSEPKRTRSEQRELDKLIRQQEREMRRAGTNETARVGATQEADANVDGRMMRGDIGGDVDMKALEDKLRTLDGFEGLKSGGKVGKPKGCGQAQRGYGKAMMGGGKIKTKSSY